MNRMNNHYQSPVGKKYPIHEIRVMFILDKVCLIANQKEQCENFRKNVFEVEIVDLFLPC